MKRIFYVIACAFIVSCSNEPKEKDIETSNVEFNEPVDTSTVSTAQESEDDTKEEQTAVSTTSGSSSEWDTAIDDYEEYIDEYVKFIKKGKAGDATALMKSVELMGKAESVSKKLEAAKNDDMSTEQVVRFSKIQTKLLEAAQ